MSIGNNIGDTKPSAFPIIPGLKSTKKNDGQLLRRPRIPTCVDCDISPCPSPNRAKSDYTYTSKIMDVYEDVESEYYQFDSPIPSGAPSLVSHPGSDLRPFRHHTQTSMGSHLTSFVSRDDTKYVLDPLYRGRSTIGPYIDAKRLVKPFKPRGPDAFPPRQPRQGGETCHDFEPDDPRYFKPPDFTLDTFLRRVAHISQMPLRRVKETMYSRHNYKKIAKLLEESNFHQPKQESVHETTFSLEGLIDPFECRIPQRQLLFEMAAMIKAHIRGLVNVEIKTVIKAMPKYSPSYTNDNFPHTEIILYQEDTEEQVSMASKKKVESELQTTDAMLHSGRTRHFQGSERSQSPFTVQDETVISPSELAILDSLIAGGKALSLKAHFLYEMPDITPMMKTITYLNLSFNDFKLVPEEVLLIEQLAVLKLRNNPLEELPADIGNLSKLQTLVASFCMLKSLPVSLYDIKTLEHLDVSYNEIDLISNDISRLRNLSTLNLEGNWLPALPWMTIKLQLHAINVKNNRMHPLFWKENMKNQPQRLGDLALLVIDKTNEVADLPTVVQNFIKKKGVCDCCRGPLFGPGLRVIRPVKNMFHVNFLPFLFSCCSPFCLDKFKNTHQSLSAMLYGRDDGEMSRAE